MYNISESEASIAALHVRHCTRSTLHIVQACNCIAFRRHIQCSLPVAAAGRKSVLYAISCLQGRGQGICMGSQPL